jgi:hypothetical protein
MKRRRFTGITLIYMLGIVDRVYDEVAHVELTSMSGETIAGSPMDLPLWMFPCKISEGSEFYFTKANETLELKCGTPQ